jgi:Glyoxalase-like domain
MSLRRQNMTMDCRNPELVATFWSKVLGLGVHGPHDGHWWLEPGGESPDIVFLAVPEEKIVKNRVHPDLRPDDQAA